MCDITPAESSQLAVLLRLNKQSRFFFFYDPSYGWNAFNVNFSYLGVRGFHQENRLPQKNLGCWSESPMEMVRPPSLSSQDT